MHAGVQMCRHALMFKAALVIACLVRSRQDARRMHHQEGRQNGLKQQKHHESSHPEARSHRPAPRRPRPPLPRRPLLFPQSRVFVVRAHLQLKREPDGKVDFCGQKNEGLFVLIWFDKQTTRPLHASPQLSNSYEPLIFQSWMGILKAAWLCSC